jgi:hypothetical protein
LKVVYQESGRHIATDEVARFTIRATLGWSIAQLCPSTKGPTLWDYVLACGVLAMFGQKNSESLRLRPVKSFLTVSKSAILPKISHQQGLRNPI